METKYVVLWVVVAAIALGALFFVFNNRNSDVSTTVKIDTSGNDYMQDLDNFKDTLNKNYTGGYTIEDSEKMQADADCPTANDQFNTMYFQDCGTYVVFYYTLKTNNGVIYPNLIFRKVGEDKLELDGLANTYLHCVNQHLKYQWKKAEIVVNFSEIPCLKRISYASGHYCSNVARVSQTCFYYWNGYIHAFAKPSKKEEQYARQLLQTAMNEVITKYFMSFNGLRLQAETADGKDVYKYINTYFAYLYNSSDKVLNTTNIAGVNGFLTYDIPESEQSNYPIPASKKADYPSDWNYYKMYKCDRYTKVIPIAQQCKNDSLKKTITKNDEVVEDDGSTECEVIIPQVVTYSEVTVKLRATNNVDFTGFDASESPVSITFTADNVIPKTLVFNTKSAILTGQNISLVMGKTYNYSIDSGALSFDSFTGTMPLLAKKGTLTLDYTYLNGAVVCEFGLNVVGDIDLSEIDLSSNPILIQLKDTNNTTYEIRISDNAYLSNNKMFTMVLPVGTYTYTIASDVLSFPSSDTSSITVSSSSRQFVFNCLRKESSFLITTTSIDSSLSSNTVRLRFPDVISVSGSTQTLLNAATVELLEYCDGHLKTYTVTGWESLTIPAGQSISSGIVAYVTSTADAYGDDDSELERQYQIKITYNQQIALSNVVSWTPSTGYILDLSTSSLPSIFNTSGLISNNGSISTGGTVAGDGSISTDEGGAIAP